VKKETLIRKIEERGCKMLKDNVKGDETREELIDYLGRCKCPLINKIFSGIPEI